MIRKVTFSDAVRKRLKKLYKKRSLTMHEFAVMIGIPYSTINTFMNAKSNSITLKTLYKMCEGLDISVQEFFNDELLENLKEDEF